ncbi:MAG TPA: enoyl-CoA hydratase/isomerase family protein [Pyrinomonadaceae bacterium]|nr:enoyl-CoA hydratase/isomerase family protein [Pyrinomonadaceae bacterium]
MNDAQPDKPCAAQAEPTDALVIEERERVAIVRFNRPAARNSLSSQTLDELDAVVAALATRQSIAAIIFTGTDDIFAAGADIRELRALMPDAALAFARRGQALMQQIAAAPQLTIAAVNGYCMGGGLDLALACDLRCAAPAAVFAHPGARLGIITGWGGTQRLPRLIGQARALEMLLTGRRVSGEEALALGLVNRVGTPVLDCALELAARRV